MRMLALDLSTKTGFSVWEDGKVVTAGLKEFPTAKGNPGLRYRDFTFWLSDLVEIWKPLDLLVVEGPHFRGRAATYILVGFFTRCLEIAALWGIKFREIHTMTLKKTVTGNYRAEKVEVMAWASQYMGKPITDDNIADSLAAAYTALTVPEKVKVKKSRRIPSRKGGK